MSLEPTDSTSRLSEPPLVELRKISKSFSGVLALDDVSLRVRAGECVGLVGENGAGKSTLMKVLSGVWPDKSFTGEILLNGKLQNFSGPKDALDAGIAIIHQELSLFDEMTVAENIWMQDLPRQFGVVDFTKINADTEALLAQFNLDILPQTLVKHLSVGEKQILEIARSFTRHVRVLIFDEPTSALSDQEIESLFTLIDGIKAKGVACLYISHKLDEIHRLCERVVVLRDGRSVKEFDSKPWSTDALIEAMVGREIANLFPPKRPGQSRKAILEVRDLTYLDKALPRPLLDQISFDVREGEVFGIAGLLGSRRTELLMALFGSLSAQKVSGEILLEGKPLDHGDPRLAIQQGLGFVTEDRKGTGLLLDRSVRENMTLPILKQISRFWKINSKEEGGIVSHFSSLLRIKAASPEISIRHLSGGNQQKVILGRWLSSKPKILLLDEPTRGIDVRAKSEIYFLMRELVDQGLTLIVVSSELPEIVSLCDRVMVLRQGRNAGILEGSSVTQQKIMERAVA